MKKTRVTGLGGIFFKANSTAKLGAWYQKHLGLPVQEWGGCSFEWRDARNPKKKGSTVWSPFPGDSKYFGPGKQGHMVNYRVANLKKLLAALKQERVWIDPKGIEKSEYGQFAWIKDVRATASSSGNRPRDAEHPRRVLIDSRAEPGLALHMHTLRLASFLLLSAAGLSAAPVSALFEQTKAQYLKDYEIELVADDEPYPVAESDGAITARNSGVRNVDMVLYFLRKEFAKYPPELVKLSGLKRIVFCRDLKANGHRIAGVAVQKNATIYLDSSTEIGDEPHRRRTLHHEFFHCVDYAMHGERDIRDNRAWVAAGAPGSSYGAAETGAPVANWASHPAAGFVSAYARKSVPEDRAELFCAIMTNNLTVRLLLQKDSFLEAKLGVLKGELKEFCPQIDEAFWAKTAKNF